MSVEPFVVGGANLKVPVAYDLVNTVQCWGDGNLRLNDLTSVADLGLNTLGIVIDPLGTILSAALDFLKDWLLANCKPFSDFVDALLGSPEQIYAQSEKWAQVAADCSTLRQDHAITCSDLQSWTGAAAEGYQEICAETDPVFETAQGAATRLGQLVTATGALVGMIREFLWQLLKTVITELIKWGLAALAAAIPSLGSSIAAFTAWATGRFAWLGAKFAGTMAKLLTKCGDIARKLGFSGKLFDDAAAALLKVAAKLGTTAANAPSTPFGHGTPFTVPSKSDAQMPFKWNDKDSKPLMDAHKKYKDLNKHLKTTGKGVDPALDQNATNQDIIDNAGPTLDPLPPRPTDQDPQQPEPPSQTDPGQPTDPTRPTDPGQPTDPSHPTDPGQPTQPSQPSQPSQPTQPSQPSQPSQPTEPSQPSQPSQPNEPTEPSQPSEPIEPTEPTQPTEPTEPTEPSQPTEPTEPTDPGESTPPSDGPAITVDTDGDGPQAPIDIRPGTDPRLEVTVDPDGPGGDPAHRITVSTGPDQVTRVALATDGITAEPITLEVPQHPGEPAPTVLVDVDGEGGQAPLEFRVDQHADGSTSITFDPDGADGDQEPLTFTWDIDESAPPPMRP